jgi:CMP/dCMP kinase
MNEVAPVITVDGPSGSGKGTMCKMLANHLGWHLLESGAIYRCLALKLLSADLLEAGVDEIVSVTKDLDLVFQVTSRNDVITLLDNKDVSSAIRDENVGMAASKIAPLSQVRLALMDRQRAFCAAPGLVADGRDMGSVVFPEAKVKFYLDASAKERATRRFKQLQAQDISVKFAPLYEELLLRDQQDKDRKASPLVVPQGALVIKTDDLSVSQVFEQMLARINRKNI